MARRVVLSLVVLALSPSLALAQAEAADQVGPAPEALRLRLGVHATSLVQPGLRLSTPIDLRTYARPGGRGQTLFAGPRLGVFGAPANHVSLQLGAVAGYRFLTPRKRRFHELRVGADYVGEWQITSLAVHRGTGNVTPRRELRSYFVPTLGYLFGREGSGRGGGYVGVSTGAFVSRALEASLYLDVEAGLQVRLGGSR